MIGDKLREKGRELMAQLGVRRTRVEDITKAAGISKGAFYFFYDSKEELFMEILAAADTEIREALWQGFSANKGNRRKQFKQAFFNVLRVMEKTPMLARFSGEDFQQLVRKLSPEYAEAYRKKDQDVLKKFVGQLKREGVVRPEIDLEVADGIFRAISMLIFQKKEIGTHVFDQVFDILLDGAIAYLVEEAEG